MRTFLIFLFLAIASVSVTADPPDPVYDNHDQGVDEGGGTCNIPGWCGNGNDRYQQIILVDGTFTYGPCGWHVGIYCGTY